MMISNIEMVVLATGIGEALELESQHRILLFASKATQESWKKHSGGSNDGTATRTLTNTEKKINTTEQWLANGMSNL